MVDVIVPLHNNFADAQRLFDSLRAAKNVARANVLVIDDASNEPAPLPVLEAGGSLLDIVWLRNPRNLGFAGSVNRGMGLSRRDVVLLNSDTLVFDGWLDRMCAVARSDPAIGTVTPLSNAATIFSYPLWPQGYVGTLETPWERIDRLCAAIDAPPIETPTAVGFCMLIKRACLDQVGLFDDVTFRDGYGEESDFCRRATAVGWSHVAATNVFVWHRSQGSFAERGDGLRAEAERRLRAKHPDYRAAVASHIRRDPLRRVREKLDLGRIHAAGRSVVLSLGDPSRAPPDRNRLLMSLERVPGTIATFRPIIDEFCFLENLPLITLLSGRNRLETLLTDTAVTEIVMPHAAVLPRILANRFVSTARSLGIAIAKEGDDLLDARPPHRERRLLSQSIRGQIP